MYPTKKKEELIKLFQKYESEDLILEDINLFLNDDKVMYKNATNFIDIHHHTFTKQDKVNELEINLLENASEEEICNLELKNLPEMPVMIFNKETRNWERVNKIGVTTNKTNYTLEDLYNYSKSKKIFNLLEENKEADIKSLQRLFNRYNTNREKHITLNIILYSIDISLEKAEDSDINILNLYFSIENNFAAAIQRYNGCKANLKYLNLEEFPYSIVR
jgi:hypothetical protein